MKSRIVFPSPSSPVLRLGYVLAGLQVQEHLALQCHADWQGLQDLQALKPQVEAAYHSYHFTRDTIDRIPLDYFDFVLYFVLDCHTAFNAAKSRPEYLSWPSQCESQYCLREAFLGLLLQLRQVTVMKQSSIGTQKLIAKSLEQDQAKVGGCLVWQRHVLTHLRNSIRWSTPRPTFTCTFAFP